MKQTALPQSRKPIRIWDILKIFLAVALLGYVLSKTDFSQLLALRYRFSWGWFGVTFALFCAMVVIKTVQYHYLTGKKLPYFRMLEVVVMQNALMNFVATAAGIASYLTMLGAEKDVRLGRATVSFVVVKMGDVIAVLFLLLGSMFLSWPLPEDVQRIAVIVIGIALLILTVFFAAVLLRRRFVNFLRKMLALVKLDKLDLLKKGMGMLESMAAQDQKKVFRLILTGILLSLIYMSVTMSWGYARLRMFSLPIGIGKVTFVHSILQIASWVPVYIFGGLGISETLSVYLFGLFGESEAEVAAVMIGARLVFYIMNAFTLLYLPLETIISGRERTKQIDS